MRGSHAVMLRNKQEITTIKGRNTMKIVHWLAGFAAAVGVLQAGVVSAQSYPNRPIKLIVPFGAGSGSDILARIIAEPLTQALGRQWLPRNPAE